MKNIFCCLFVLSLLFSSCSSESEPESENPEPGNTESILSSFNGNYSNGWDNFSGEGVVRIENNDFSFISDLGTLEGEAMLQTEDGETFYTVTVNQGSGVFESTNTMSGRVYSDYVNLEGTNNAGEFAGITGELMTIEEANEQWSAERDKSLIVFSNLHPCDATITLNEETLSGLDKHYYEGGFCSPYYDLWNSIAIDVENSSSSLSCNDVTLEMMDGSFQTFETCYVAHFVVDKLTEYEYTVEWDNGETTTGTVTSADGGLKEVVCVDNSGEDCIPNEESDPILITNNTLAIDYENSDLPQSDYDYSIFVDETVFTIEPVTMQGDAFSKVTIGEPFATAPSGGYQFAIELYIRNGIANDTYPIELWSQDAPLGINVVFGSSGVFYSNAGYPNGGTITISNYNEAEQTCTIDFEDVTVSIDSNIPPYYDMTFSGNIDGSFTIED